MSAAIASTVLLASGGDCSTTDAHAGSNCGFEPPSLGDFNFRPIFHLGSYGFYKPELLALMRMAAAVPEMTARARPPQMRRLGHECFRRGAPSVFAVRALRAGSGETLIRHPLVSDTS